MRSSDADATRNPEHGGVPWYLMVTIVAAIGVGLMAYRVLRERRIAAATEAARAPKPVPRPVQPAPVPEAPVEAPVTAEPEEPVPAEAPVAVDDGTCDEVSCVIDNFEAACCAKFKRPRPSRPAAGGPPESLDRAMISTGIDNVKGRIALCGDATTATGMVRVKVMVLPDGRVSTVEVRSTPDPALGACVAGIVKKARFAATQSGGSFSYPFVF
jgi:TonB family protein